VPQFRFPLAAVLRVREHVKKQKQLELALLNQTRANLEGEIESLQRECDGAAEDLTHEPDAIYSAEEFRVRADYTSSILLRLTEREARLAALNQELATKRDEAVEAMRAVKALEQLRARMAENFWRDLKTSEQKLNDESGLRKFLE
jgi:flagellar export protein FliJ